MKNTILLLTVFSFVFLLSSCKDDDEAQPKDALDGTSWYVSLVDQNPSSSTDKYYDWKTCNLDDVLTFKDGKVTIDNGGSICDDDDLISFISSQNYTYDSSAKILTLGLFKADVKELTSSDLKIVLEIPGVLEATTFMFKKK